LGAFEQKKEKVNLITENFGAWIAEAEVAARQHECVSTIRHAHLAQGVDREKQKTAEGKLRIFETKKRFLKK
jgi:hypothetical protein